MKKGNFRHKAKELLTEITSLSPLISDVFKLVMFIVELMWYFLMVQTINTIINQIGDIRKEQWQWQMS